MIEINLLPEELKKKKKEPQIQLEKIDLSKLNFQNVPVIKILIGTAALLVAVPVLLFLIGIYATSHISAMEKDYKKISPEKREVELLKSQVDTINKKVGSIDELMVKRFSWARKLNDLADSMTPGIWLTELSYNEKIVDRTVTIDLKTPKGKGPANPTKSIVEKVPVKNLIISGYATGMGEEGTASVGKFIKSLKENPDFYSDFSDIELGSIKRDKVEEQEVMNFKITCLYKEAK
ncbi:MAG: PilN domain-containing protein [Candidatus Omnitrophota bacterium]